MADTHEEQLLSELLREVGDADRAAPTPAPDVLEARVLAGCDTAALSDSSQVWTPVVVAGVAAALVIAVASVWSRLPVAGSQLPVVSSQLPVASSQLPVASSQLPVIQPPIAIAQSPIAEPITQSPITQSPMSEPQAPVPNPQSPSDLAFLPLGPLSEQELSGPIQLVRVQMPAASLGGLASPLLHPGELVTADVLLGEDGVARGIRIASDGSNYPWRFR